VATNTKEYIADVFAQGQYASPEDQQAYRDILGNADYDTNNIDNAVQRYLTASDNVNALRSEVKIKINKGYGIQYDDKGDAFVNLELNGRTKTITWENSHLAPGDIQNPLGAARAAGLDVEQAIRKTDFRTYYGLAQAMYNTTDVQSVNISGGWRPGTDPHAARHALDINRINDQRVNIREGTTQPDIVKRFSVNIKNAGATQVIQPWMTYRLNGLNPSIPRADMGHGFIENAQQRGTLEYSHRDHLHFSFAW